MDVQTIYIAHTDSQYICVSNYLLVLFVNGQIEVKWKYNNAHRWASGCAEWLNSKNVLWIRQYIWRYVCNNVRLCWCSPLWLGLAWLSRRTRRTASPDGGSGQGSIYLVGRVGHTVWDDLI